MVAGPIQRIRSREARVMIVDFHAGVRQLVAMALRQLGFRDFLFARDIKELRHQLNFAQPIDWIISTLEGRERQNIMDFADGFYERHGAASARISILLSDKASASVPVAFEQGIMSWHRCDLHFDALTDTFVRLLQRLDHYQEDERQLAAAYLREYFESQASYAELMQLEKSLTATDIGDQRQVLALARACFLAGRIDEGSDALNRVRYYDAGLAEEAAALYDHYVNSSHQEAQSFAASLGIRNALIIDHDDIAKHVMRQALERVGITQVSAFDDGMAAWEHLRAHTEPHLILSEWRVRNLSGPFLIQRIRSLGFKSVPIVITSSQLTRDDAQLVKDMYVAQVLKKPLRESQLILAIAWTLKQCRQPTEYKPLERKIVTSLMIGEMGEARLLKQQFDGLLDISQARRDYVEACLHYYQGRYEEASRALIASISAAEGDNVDATDLLARSLLKMGDVRAALRLMEKASSLSPKNIERLCELADMALQTGETRRASQLLDRAEGADKGHELVISVGAKYSMLTRDFDRARELMASLHSLENVVVFMNNRGAALIKSGDLKEGISWYFNALRAMPSEHPEYFAIVNYNLALALIKNTDPKLAAVYLKKAVDVGARTRVYLKAVSLRERLRDAIQRGQTLRLMQADEAVTTPMTGAMARLLGETSLERSATATPLAVGLLGVYRASEHEWALHRQSRLPAAS